MTIEAIRLFFVMPGLVPDIHVFRVDVSKAWMAGTKPGHDGGKFEWPMETTATEHVDVLIVGAGLSGIGAGYHLQRNCPAKSFVILEGRDCSGGTWDLFRYPGIRSDSDMFTMGYSFKPWKEPKAIADGPQILNYVRETAAEIVRFTCNFLFMCSGYYKYEEGYTPEFSGRGDFTGPIVHPQKWPEDLDYAGKRVVVVGSGATAVTLVPAMARTAAHVTMLQRSPTYVVSLPAEDPIANLLRRVLPSKLAYSIVRWKNVALTMLSFQLSRRRPGLVKAMLRKGLQ